MDVKDVGYYSGKATVEVKHKDWSSAFPISYAFTISKAKLSVTINDCNKIYGDVNPRFSFNATGFVEKDNAENSIVNISYKTSAEQNSDVGSYPISMSADSKNYELTITEGHLNVIKAPLTVCAENAEKIYGDSISTLVRSYIGLKLNDKESTVFSSLPNISCSATKMSKVGEYPIIVSGGISKNYEIQYKNGTLKITKAPLTLIANNKSRLYFEENPAFDYSLSGLRNSDTEKCITTQPAFKCLATKTSNAGEYEIEPLNAFAQNYEFKYQNGRLKVNRREITATIGSYTKIYGTENPKFTISYNGFVNNEDESVITKNPYISCLANQKSDVGTYSIQMFGGEAQNYIISKYNFGTLTIEKADQTLILNQDLSNVKQYSQIALEAKSSAGLPVSYEMSPNNVATLYKSNGTWFLDCFGSGAVNIRAVQNGDQNYNAAPTLTKTLVVSGTGETPSTPQVFLNVENTGTLPSLIAENRKYQIKNLRLTGYLNGTDIRYLREMAGCNEDGKITSGVLETLDISGCTIVSGGESYYKYYYTANNKIGDFMFFNCQVLVNLMLPNNTTTIKDYAFADCGRLSVISIPDDVDSLGAFSFLNDISLLRIPIPSKLTYIGNYAFMGCNGITEINLPQNTKYIGKGIVKDCQNISKINIDEGNSDFASKNGVLYTSNFDELLIFPQNYNSSIYTVENGATRIAPYAFINAKKLTDVVMPSSLLTIGKDAFIGCTNLSSFYTKALNPPVCDNDCFESISKTRCNLLVSQGCYSYYYWVAPVWSDFNHIQESDFSNNIIKISDKNIKAFVEGRNIRIKGVPAGVNVHIFGSDGVLEYLIKSEGKEILYRPKSLDTYLVVIRSKTYKLLIK